MPNVDYRDDLVERHVRLARRIAGDMHRQLACATDYRELEAMAYEGLVQAARRYDPTADAAFSTFAYYRIRGAVIDGLRAGHQLVRGRALAAADDYLQAAATHRPRLSRASDALRDLYTAACDLAAIQLLALTDETPPAAPDPETALHRAQLAASLRAAVDRLPARERHFIRAVYFEHKSMTEAGAELGLSRSRSSRVHARAITQLRAMLQD